MSSKIEFLKVRGGPKGGGLRSFDVLGAASQSGHSAGLWGSQYVLQLRYWISIARGA